MTKPSTPKDASGGSISETPSTDNGNKSNETNWKDFAVSILTSPEAVMRIMDEQRIERLQHCRVLQQALRECREQHQPVQPRDKKESSSSSSPSSSATTSNSWFWFWNNKRTSTPPSATEAQATTTTTITRAQLEDFPMGIRMMRYFLWRDMPDDGRRPPCLREEHALWACRGVALRCGPDLMRLRDCFKEHGPEQILSQGTTSYEIKKDNTKVKKGDSDNKFFCLDFQTKLGACIGQNAKALEERVQKRRQAKPQSEMESNKEES